MLRPEFPQCCTVGRDDLFSHQKGGLSSVQRKIQAEKTATATRSCRKVTFQGPQGS